MKKWLVILLVFAVFLIGFGFIYTATTEHRMSEEKKATDQVKAKEKKKAKQTTEIGTPTLFVHGYAGTKNSLGSMMSRLEEADGAHKALVITVKKDGTLSIKGKYDKFSRRPLIQVLFEDSKSSMVNQTEWLKTVCAALKRDYHIVKINAVAHSMGGVSFTNYLEKTSTQNAYPITEKLVLMGAPLNGLAISDSRYELSENGPKTETERYANLYKNRENIPKSIQVYTIAGDVLDGTESDGSVPLASALSAKFIFQNVASYNEKVFSGKAASHSNLHENEEIDQTVSEFLWD
ncbi:alpha/beta hydrolase [Listeria aquatica]|uniref:alpha/beta hydrolase n=1 Tax=Listeria aquatica TaxID=1494960 RepID=UPI003F71BE76